MPEARRPTAFHSNHFKMSIYLSNLESQTINRDPDNNGVNIQVLNKTINFPFYILFFFSLMLIAEETAMMLLNHQLVCLC